MGVIKPYARGDIKESENREGTIELRPNWGGEGRRPHAAPWHRQVSLHEQIEAFRIGAPK